MKFAFKKVFSFSFFMVTLSDSIVTNLKMLLVLNVLNTI